MKPIAFTARLWKYPGDTAAWFFVTLGAKESAAIKASQKKRVGFGSVRVTAVLGKTSWKTSVFPTKEGRYLLPVKAEVRKKEDVGQGDDVRIRITLG